MAHSYRTIEGAASAEYEEKKSRFLAHVAHVETEDEALAFLEMIRSTHPMARHNVYAYVLREGNRIRYSDDGEPAKTSGLPTLSVIEHEELKDVICVTTRYFGGVLLGTGGLVRAYTKAAQDAFLAARKVMIAECVDLSIESDYSFYETIRHWADQQHIEIVRSDFTDVVVTILRVPSIEADAAERMLIELTQGQTCITRGAPAFQPLSV